MQLALAKFKACVVWALIEFTIGCHAPNDASIDPTETPVASAPSPSHAPIAAHPDNPAPWGLPIGVATVADSLAKYPPLTPRNDAYLFYGHKQVPAASAYAMFQPDHSLLVLQFDEHHTLQAALSLYLPTPYETLVADFAKQYAPYGSFTSAEFEAFNRAPITFAEHQAYWQAEQHNLRLFRQGDVLIAVGRHAENDTSNISYLNTAYLPVLKEKAVQIPNALAPSSP